MTPSSPRSPRSTRSVPTAAASVAVAVLATLGGALAVDASARPVPNPAAPDLGISAGAGADVARLTVALRNAPATTRPSDRPAASGGWQPVPAAPSATPSPDAGSAATANAPANDAPAATEAAHPASSPTATPAQPASAAPAAPPAAPKASPSSAPAAAPTTAPPAPAPQAAALVLNISRSGASQSLIDACAGPVLWGAGGGYPPAGLVGQHNYCGGGAFMGLHPGDIVQVNGLSAGTYRVQNTMVIPGRSNAYAGQFGNADMALQTCTWDNQSYFYALLVRA